MISKTIYDIMKIDDEEFVNYKDKNNGLINFDAYISNKNDYKDKLNDKKELLKQYNKLSSELFTKIIHNMTTIFDMIPESPYCMFYADINKINKLWKNDNHYISRNFKKIKNQMKYINSREDLFNLKVKEPPILSFLSNNTTISFTNGRHRFANLRDLKAKYIPVIMPLHQHHLLEKIVYIEK